MTELKWVTYTQAAHETGRSARTIRRWVREKHLTPWRNRINRGQLLQVETKMRAARRTGKQAML